MAMDRSLSAAAVGAWAVAGLAAGAVFAMLVFAPATWLVRAVNAIGQGRVVLSDSAGTVWSGSARLALAGGAGSRDTVRLPGRVQWAIAPGWGTLGLTLRADCCTPEPLAVVLAPQWQGWQLQVQRSQSSWPASLLAGLGTPWNTLQLQGNLVLTTPGLTLATSLDRWTLQGTVQLEAQDLQSRLSSLRPLGTYQLRVAGGAQPSLALTTLRGDLLLDGRGRWTAGQLRFEGEANATPSHAQELSNLLNIMGRRDGARSIITLG